MGRKRRAGFSRRVRRALDLRNEWAGDVGRCEAELDTWLAKQDEFERSGGDISIALTARLSWARVELADALKNWRRADRKVQRLMER